MHNSENTMKLVCNICHIENRNITSHVQHSRLHSTVPNCTFICPIDGCITSCKRFETFKLHLYMVHAQQRRQQWLSEYKANAGSQTCRCAFASCQYKCSNLYDFIQHFKVHINDGHSVPCPFTNCNGVFKIVSSFTSHISRQHKSRDNETVKPEYKVASASSGSETLESPAKHVAVEISEQESEMIEDIFDSSDDNETCH